MAANSTIYQTFEWYSGGSEERRFTEDEQKTFNVPPTTRVSHWQHLNELLPALAALGITSLWIPPACKATGPFDNGYGVYDLYDLGEFKTNGSIATKWGVKSDLQALCAKAKSLGVSIIFDTVLNHRAAPDETEACQAVRVDPRNRKKLIDKIPHSIQAGTRFNYSSRNGEYSAMKYNWTHFSGVDWDHKTREKAIFKIVGKRSDGSVKDWAADVGTTENGNFDYLMFADVDYGSPDVCEDVLNWVSWLLNTLPGVTGLRLDAAKHYSASFQRKLINHVDLHFNKDGNKPFLVAEYWSADTRFLASHLDRSFAGTNLHLFDVKLMYNFHDLSTGRLRDLRQILSRSLVTLKPDQAVTFVANHDTQETQSLAAPVETWFIPHAYATILLRAGGQPCVFCGDTFGTKGPESRDLACGGRLMRLVMARKYYAYGKQEDYFDDSKCIGWVRFGTQDGDKSCGMAVVLNASWSWCKKRMRTKSSFAGQIWSDLMGWAWSGVSIDRQGYGDFVAGPRSISVWTWKDAPFRQEVDGLEYPKELASIDNIETVDEVESMYGFGEEVALTKPKLTKSPL